MPFIGIVSKENDSNFIKNQILKNAKFSEFQIININKKSVINVKNIKFETIIINDEVGDLVVNSKYFNDILINSKNIIVNTDIIKNTNFLENLDAQIITYGRNQKAIITVSSVKENNIMIYIQKTIQKTNSQILEPEETNIYLKKNNMKKICNLLAVFAILKIYE